ncbi:inovirus Gp2 family protein [Serratia marcescens]|uniref:inovirus Gp2 family protein n=1 Tax=Serratia marcescens TaxID=615 RepID=UPI00215D7942|nr:inovirus Gp2 family protein [Serratia marcescens]
MRYAWVREVGERNRRKHYHVLLLLNKDFYYGAGKFDSNDSLAALVQQAWCSALNVDREQYSALVNLTKNGMYYLNSNSSNYIQQVTDLLNRMDYLAKTIQSVTTTDIAPLGRVVDSVAGAIWICPYNSRLIDSLI